MNLFKVIAARDDVTVGFAQEMDAELMAKQLAKDGYIRAWQYAAGRAEDGSLVQKPQHEIVIMGAQVVRIEPVAANQPVIAPPR